jgi:hypothetical protein
VTKFDLTFEDGATRTVNRRPIHDLRVERVINKNTGPNEQVLIGLWFADSKEPVFSQKNFDEWLNALDGWEIHTEEEADDSPPARQLGTSPS